MPVINIKLPFKNGSIIQMGDSHFGTIAQVKRKLDEAVRIIKDERNCLWVNTGDNAESIIVDDPRYESDQHSAPTIDRQIEDVIQTFKPIAKKLICMNVGNHELTLMRTLNVTYAILKGMDRVDAYGAWTSIVNFHDNEGRKKWTGFWTHGTSKHSLGSTAGDAGQQKANTEAKLKKILSPLHSANYMGCGHYHKVVLRPPAKSLYLTADDNGISAKYTDQPKEGYIHPDLRWYGCNGGFLKQYLMSKEYPNDSLGSLEPITYSERAGYPPVEMGIIKLNIKNYMLDLCETIML